MVEHVSFLESLLVINGRYDLDLIVINSISHILNARFGNALNFEYSQSTRKFVVELLVDLGRDEMFDPNIINELIHIHQSYVFSASPQAQFFESMITILRSIRDDWDEELIQEIF